MSASPYKDYTKQRTSIENFALFCESSPYSAKSPTKIHQFPSSFQSISLQTYNTPERTFHHVHSPSVGSYTYQTPKVALHTPIASGASVQSPSTISNYGSPNVKTGLSYATSPFAKGYSSEMASPQSNKPSMQSAYGLEPFPSFLNRIGAASHQEANRLSQISILYSSVRVLPEREESVFNAACCCFFEKILTIESFDMMNSSLGTLFTHDEWLHSQMFLFVTLLKAISYDPTHPNKVQKFYEILSRDSGLYQKGVAAFKEVVTKILKQIESIDTTYLRVFYKWMNEFDKTAQEFFKRLAQVLQFDIKVLVLTTSALQEELFLYNRGFTNSDSSPTKANVNTKEFVILYHKSGNQAYILNSSPTDSSPLSKENGLSDYAFIKSTYTSFSSSPYKSAQELEPSFTSQPFQLNLLSASKENTSDYKYSDISNKKPKITIDTMNVKSTSLYSSPLPAPTSLPQLQGKKDYPKSPSINLESDYINSPYNYSSALSSNWLSSNNSFSDIPSTPGTPQGSFFDNITLITDTGLQPKLKDPSPLNVMRNVSDDKRMSVPQSARVKPWKQGGLLDQLEEAYKTPQVLTPNRLLQKNQHFLTEQDDNRRHSYRGSTFSKQAQLVKESLFTKETTFEKGLNLSGEKKPVLPDNLKAKLKTINQKLDSHNFEFSLVTSGHVGKKENKNIKDFKIWNLDGLVSTYNDLIASKKNNFASKSEPIYAATTMSMDN